MAHYLLGVLTPIALTAIVRFLQWNSRRRWNNLTFHEKMDRGWDPMGQ